MSVECPWCYRKVVPRHGRCPQCKEEIYLPPEEAENDEAPEAPGVEDEEVFSGMTVERAIEHRFKSDRR